MEKTSIIETIYVKDVYEVIAKHFSVTRVFTWDWIRSFIEKLENNSTIYDIGCGNGRNMNFPNQNFIGIDNCCNFLDICKRDGKNVINSNMTKIDLPDDSADAIICIAAFHHLSSIENRIKALNEMRRLIKPNKKILLSVWSINQPKKTRVTFNKYGNSIVKWNNIYERYYYIFNNNEIKQLFKIANLKLLLHNYDCGNEIFILTK
jgi:ubiquinone/menaquinone biosynthesis C-methylase UbiE|tara:strand:+ start:7726 stop:8343 length:618 start_codon:yes stop_codon:yes gene_type:complete